MLKKLAALICCIVLLLLGIGVVRYISEVMHYIEEKKTEMYPGSAATILEQNTALLNQAADILWNTPEAFHAIEEEGEIYTQFTMDEMFTHPFIEKHFSIEEKNFFQDVVSKTQLVNVGMYFPVYGHAQTICFSFSCTDKSQRELCYIRPADGQSSQALNEQVENILNYMTYDWVTYQPTDYPNWYIQIRTAYFN